MSKHRATYWPRRGRARGQRKPSPFRNGASSNLEVLDAQRALYPAMHDAITLRLTEQVNRVARQNPRLRPQRRKPVSYTLGAAPAIDWR